MLSICVIIPVTLSDELPERRRFVRVQARLLESETFAGLKEEFRAYVSKRISCSVIALN
jgi:hypothetical protein